MRDWKVVVAELQQREREADTLRHEWQEIKRHCAHPRLPIRRTMENYTDTCPDCGHVSYCQEI